MDDPLLYHKLIEKRNGDDGQSKLVALVDIPKSDRLVSSSWVDSIVCCSYPMAIVPVFSLLPYVSSYCYKRLKSLSRCSKCRIIRYCSKECQRADWFA